MALRMTCPTKRNGSENWYYRRRIPADVQAILAGMPKSRRPRNWSASEINISLRTADREVAKAKCPEVAAEVERAIAALRAGPQPLSQKQISALSGELYFVFARGMEDNPDLTPEGWLRVAIWNDQARDGRYGTGPLRIGKEAQQRASMEERFGKMVDSFLAKRGFNVDDDSRWRLLDRASIDLAEAAKKLSRNAEGDYTPDEYAKRFPAFEQPCSDTPPHSLTELVKAWRKAAEDRGVKKRDADRIDSRFRKLIAFLKHDDARRVTRKDIIRWRDQRQSQGIESKTINDSDIASFSNVFNWGVERGWLDQNPAEKTAIKSKRQKAQNREKYFSPSEIAAILRQAAATVGSDREDRKTTAAKRWVPWLLAYSGARVAEMVQLRKQDVRKDDEHGWIIRLTPEAGSIKTHKFCDVPVHEHLVAEGFIDFVEASNDGALFCQIGADGTIQGSAGGIYSRIRNHVREVVTDKDVQPNHAWRYTFKTMGLEARIDPFILDALSNHVPRHQGGEYTKVTLKARAEAMARFPRYRLDLEQVAAQSASTT